MIGSTLSDRYELLAELGRGGMGVVYRARDALLDREVAVKLIPPALVSAESEQRFRREAQLVGQMDHPAIVPIYDFGRHGESLFLVMPLLRGLTLRRFLREGSPSLGDVIDAGIEIAEALDYSHARGVVHRDVKPENVMVLREESGRVRVRLMDFGLARAVVGLHLTTTGALVGTIAYLSPEQVAKREVDTRCDVYALGTVLYECLAGEPPFAGGELESVLYRIVHEIPRPPRALGALIDEPIEAMILACLAKEPSQRPHRAAEVAEALRSYRWRLRDSDLARSVVLLRTAPVTQPPLTPFLGRGKEFAELQQRLQAALGGECQLVLIGGEPGVGKSRLLDELETLARARKLRVLRARTIEQDRAFPYQGFCELIQEYLRQKEAGSSAVAELSDLATGLVDLFPTLGEIEELRSAVRQGEPGPSAKGPEDRSHVFELLARTLARIGGGRPLVLLLEDLQGAEVSIEALQYVVRRLGPTPTLVVGTYHSTEVDALHPLWRMREGFRGDRRFLSISLGALAPGDHRALVDALVGGRELSDKLAAKLYEATEGNPFFTEELVRALLASGGIVRDPSEVWRLSGATLPLDTLPATIQEAVEKRVRRLPPALQETLAIAAVLGRSFDARDLASLAEGTLDVEDALEQLLKEGLLQEERGSRGDLLRFASGVVRDVLYVGLSRRRRRALHRAYAERLEARHAGRLDRVLPQLLHHYAGAGVAEKAVAYGLNLAQRSLEAFSPKDALRALLRVLEHVEDESWGGSPAQEAEARVLLSQAYRLLGDLPAALRESEAAARAFESAGQAARCASACLLAAEIAWQARRTEEASVWVERGIERARAAGEAQALERLLTLGATAANLRGEHARARELLEEAEASRPQDAAARAAAPAEGGWLAVALVNPVRATHPVEVTIVEEEEVLLNAFETLIGTDAGGNLVPALCESWRAREEARAFSLTLRPGVRFQDGGALTAEEVKRCFERSIRRVGRGELPPAFAALSGVHEYVSGQAPEVAALRAPSERTLEVRLGEPLPIFPALLTDSLTAVARPAGGQVTEAPWVGTGPFRLVSHDPRLVRLERSPGHWRGAPRLDGIEFRCGLSAAAIAASLRAAELDVARDLLPEDLEELLRDPRFRRGFVETPKDNAYFVLFNCRSPLGGSEELRRVLSATVRTHDLVWRSLGRLALPAHGLLPPGILGHDPGRRRDAIGREEAAAALRAAGLEPPVRVRAAVHPLLHDRYGSLTRALLEAWRELGVEVEFVASTLEAFLASFGDCTGLDLMLTRWNADYPDPDNFTHGLFHSRAGIFRAWFSSEETDRLAEQARAESRPEVRESLYRRFEDLLLARNAIVPLCHDVDYRVAGPRLRGLKLRSSAPFVSYAELGLAPLPAAAPALRRSGGVVHVPVAGTLGSLDPALAWAVEEGEVLPCVYESLTRVVEGARVVPWLAAEMSAEQRGRRLRFRLRDDVRFHDGRRLGARDVRHSFERLLRCERSQRRAFLSPLHGARALLEGRAGELPGFEILSAGEFALELEQPLSFFPVLLAHVATAIVPEGSDPPRPGAPACPGTGPFRILRYDADSRLELARHVGYWRAGYPRAEGLVFHLGLSPERIAAEFRAGRLSLASDLLPRDAEALRSEPAFAAGFREAPQLSTYLAAFNVRRGPFRDAALRLRLARALDVDALVPRTLGPLAVPAHGVIPPGLLGHDAAHPRAEGHAGTPPQAAPVEATAAVHPVLASEFAAVTREILAAFREQGVLLRPVTEGIDAYLSAVSEGAVDVALGRWIADYPDADTFVHGMLHSREGFFGRLAGSTEIDALAERGRAEADPALRHSLYRRYEETVVREALLLPLFHEQTCRFARPELDGLKLGVSRPVVAYEGLALRR